MTPPRASGSHAWLEGSRGGRGASRMAPRLHRVGPTYSPPRRPAQAARATARVVKRQAGVLAAPSGARSAAQAPESTAVALWPRRALGGAAVCPAGPSGPAGPGGDGSPLHCPRVASLPPRGVQALSAAAAAVGPASAWDAFWRVVEALGQACERHNWDIMVALSRDRGCTPRHPDGAPPRQVLRALEEARASGVDVVGLADTVVQDRFLCKTVPSTLRTYASHLRMVAWACELFGAPPLGCAVQHIRRVAAVCVCASTQRGWLSAWALAHQVAGVPWQEDLYTILRRICLDTAKCSAPRLPRHRFDRRLLRRLLRDAMSQQHTWWCVIAALAYNFLLRMPSELFAQCERALVQPQGGRFVYGPIRRKQRVDLCTVFSFCTCGVDAGICLHTWLPVWDELLRSGGRPLGGYTPASWTSEFRCHLRAIGVACPEEWFGHDVRRGAAADVFAASGVDAMLARGGWRSVASARPYVSGDEVAAGLMAQGVVDDSGPEN